MATVTSFTSARMQEIEDTTVVSGLVDIYGHLILSQRDGGTIDAGNVVGPAAPNLADASTTVKGIAELATAAEAAIGTDTARVLTPASIKAITDSLAYDNLTINGDFRINQRGYSSGDPISTFFLDRWRCENPSATELNSNANFESSTVGWTARNGASTPTRSSTQKRSGTYSMSLLRSGTSDDYVDKTFTGLTTGASYKFSAWAYLTAGNMPWEDRGIGLVGGEIKWVGYDRTKLNEWQYLSITIVLTSGTSIAARIYANSATDALYIDDASLKLAPTVTFTGSDQGRILTIPADHLVSQVIEKVNVPSGIYTLSWTGTAQARVYDYGTTPGSLSAGPVTVTVSGTTHLVIEFGTGTLTNVNFRLGSIIRPFSPRPYGLELSLCQRYYYQIIAGPDKYFAWGQMVTTTICYVIIDPPVTMFRQPYIISEGSYGGVAPGVANWTLTTALTVASEPAFNGSIVVQATISGSITVGYMAGVRTVNSSAVFALFAEII